MSNMPSSAPVPEGWRFWVALLTTGTLIYSSLVHRMEAVPFSQPSFARRGLRTLPVSLNGPLPLTTGEKQAGITSSDEGQRASKRALEEPANQEPFVQKPAGSEQAVQDPAVSETAVQDPTISELAHQDPAVSEPRVQRPDVEEPNDDEAAVAASQHGVQEEEEPALRPDTVAQQQLEPLVRRVWKVVRPEPATPSLPTKEEIGMIMLAEKGGAGDAELPPDAVSLVSGSETVHPSLSDVVGPGFYRRSEDLKGLEGYESRQKRRSESESHVKESGGDRKRVCIAVPSASRQGSSAGEADAEGQGWLSVELIRNLARRKAAEKASDGRYEFQVVVYSATCPVPDWTGPLAHRAAAQEAALQDASLEVSDSIDVRVIGPNPETCSLASEMEASLKVGADTDASSALMWRTKVTVDFVYVLRQCLSLDPDYVLFLEDDVVPAWAYDFEIEHFIEEDLRTKDWAAATLYNPSSYLWDFKHMDKYAFPCCKQSILWKAAMLPGLLEFVEGSFARAPGDWLISHYMKEKSLQGFVHAPSVFQHVGRTSSKQDRTPNEFHSDIFFHEDLFRGLMFQESSTLL